MRRVVFDSNWGVFFIRDTENLSEIPYDSDKILSYGNDIINLSSVTHSDDDERTFNNLIISEVFDNLHEPNNIITIFDEIVFFVSKQVEVHDSENNIFFFKKLNTNYARVRVSVNKDYEMIGSPWLFHITVMEAIEGSNNDKS